MANNRPIFRYHLIVALLMVMITPKYSSHNQAVFAVFFAFILHIFSIGLGVLYFKTRKVRRLELDIIISCLIIFVVTNFITNKFGLLETVMSITEQRESLSFLYRSVIRLSMSFLAGGLQYCFSNETDFDSSKKVYVIYIFLGVSFFVFVSEKVIFKYLENRRGDAPSNWVNEDIRHDSFTPLLGITFKYSHPKDWIEHYYYNPKIGTDDFQFLYSSERDSLLKSSKVSLPINSLFFAYDMIANKKEIQLETRIFRAISEDSTSFISKKQTERGINGDKCTQYDLETAKTITKQFCFKKNEYLFLCSFWSTDKQLFKQKEAVMDSIANTFYLSSF